VSLLGTFEQLKLKHVLKRLETHEKSGLLVVQQAEQWVELYFQQGRLLCIGPDRMNTPLEDRLVQAGVISQQARQDVLQASDITELNETRVAMLLLERECVTREALRSWASKEAVQVLQQVLAWSSGEIYFEDEVKPPAGRLLVALSIDTLLTSISTPAPAPQPTRSRITTVLVKDESASSSVSSAPQASSTPPLVRASQLLPDPESIPTPRTTVSLFSPETSLPSNNTHPPVVAPLNGHSELTAGGLKSAFTGSPGTPANNLPARQIISPTVPKRIDTSFMKPEMVLMPTDLASLRQQNSQIQLTPEQWQLFTLVDGRTSLQEACQALGSPPPLICQVVGELIALGLIYLLPPGTPATSPDTKQPVTAGLSNEHQAGANTAKPRLRFVPTRKTDPLRSPAPAPILPGRSQRNFAQPMPVAQSGSLVKEYYSQPAPLTQSGRQMAVNASYAQTGSGR
jgi:Domain of unknown function (DUF4388)